MSVAAPGAQDVAEPDLADEIAAAVLAVPGVAGLHAGTFGEVATYLPGRRVTGVRVRPDVTEVHVVLSWGAPVLPTADAIRAAVAPLAATRVDVTVQDVVTLDEKAAPAKAAPAKAAPAKAAPAKKTQGREPQ